MHIWNIDTPESGSFEKVQSWRVFAKYRCFEESYGSAGENISSIQRTQKHVPDPSFCSGSLFLLLKTMDFICFYNGPEQISWV